MAKLGTIMGGDLKLKSANISASKKSPPRVLMLRKYGIPMYIGSHIAPQEQIEAIRFDGRSCNNEISVTFGGWPGVRILGVLKKQ